MVHPIYPPPHSGTPASGPCKNPTPQGREGSRCDLPPRDPLPSLERTVLTGTHPRHPSRPVNLHLHGPLFVCWDTPAAHTDLHPALLNNPPLGSHHILPSVVLLVYLYMTPELFRLSVNLHFTSLLGFLGKLHLKQLVHLLALQSCLDYLI